MNFLLNSNVNLPFLPIYRHAELMPTMNLKPRVQTIELFFLSADTDNLQILYLMLQIDLSADIICRYYLQISYLMMQITLSGAISADIIGR